MCYDGFPLKIFKELMLESVAAIEISKNIGLFRGGMDSPVLGGIAGPDMGVVLKKR